MLISPAYAQAVGGGGGGTLTMILPLVLIFAVFYFLLIRPQQARAKQHKRMINELKRGDRVVTGGGIIGSVSKIVSDTELQVEIAEGVRIQIVRATITEVLGKPEPRVGTPANEGAKPQAGGIFGRLFGGPNRK